MKKIVSALVLASAAVASSANAAVIINEVYGGGGSNTAGATYTRDFVELLNNGTTSIDLSGYRLTYASSAGNFGTNDVLTFGSGSFIAAGDTLLLVTGAAGTAGTAITGANFYATNAAGAPAGASLSGTAGSVTLIDNTLSQVDTVGFGAATTATDANGLIKREGAANAPAPASTAASISRTGGIDTNQNGVDFLSVTPSPLAGTRSAVFVPEPTTLAAIAGLGLLGGFRRRRA